MGFLKDLSEKYSKYESERKIKVAENKAKTKVKIAEIKANGTKRRMEHEAKCKELEEEIKKTTASMKSELSASKVELSKSASKIVESTKEVGKFIGTAITTESPKMIKKRQEKEYQKERLQQLKKEHTPFCPKCKSTSLTYLDKRKKLSLGRAVVGGAIGSLAGPLGTAAGATMGGLSSDKIKKGKVKCLNCGHTWKL